MALQVNVHEAKTQLSRLPVLVEAGQEVVIARAGVPIARLVPAADARGAWLHRGPWPAPFGWPTTSTHPWTALFRTTTFPPAETMARLLLDTHLVLWWHSGIPILTSSLVVPPGHGQQNVARTPLIGRLEVVKGHRDPFDRLLVARSRCEPMLLLSADRKLEANGTTLRLV